MGCFSCHGCDTLQRELTHSGGSCGGVHTIKAISHRLVQGGEADLDGLSCIYSDLIICGISVRQPQVKVLYLEIQIRKNELQAAHSVSESVRHVRFCCIAE